MGTDFSVIEGPYFNDILDQPNALVRTLPGLELSDKLRLLARRLRDGEFTTVVLTGMGASFHALHPLNIELVNYGLTSLMVETSELLHYQNRFLNPRTLIVAVSQSGQSVETVRLLEMNAGRAAVAGITNTAGSLLAERADVAILTQAGTEFSVSCKTYVTALMALHWFGEVICVRDLQETRQRLAGAGPAVRDYLAGWKMHVENLAQMLAGVRNLFVVGRGASLAAAGAGALIVKESDHFHAEGMSGASFRHGPFEMLSDDTLVLVFAGDAKTRDLNQTLLADVRAAGGRAEIIGEDAKSACHLPSVPESILPILEILPLQMATLALAALKGREPGRFERCSKVTSKE